MYLSSSDRHFIEISREYKIKHTQKDAMFFILEIFLSDYNNLKHNQNQATVRLDYTRLMDYLAVSSRQTSRVIKTLVDKELIEIIRDGYRRFVSLKPKAMHFLNNKQLEFLNNKLDKFIAYINNQKEKVSKKIDEIKNNPLAKEIANKFNINITQKAKDIVSRTKETISSLTDDDYAKLEKKPFKKTQFKLLEKIRANKNKPFFRPYHINNIKGAKQYLPHTSYYINDDNLVCNNQDNSILSKEQTNAMIHFLSDNMHLLDDITPKLNEYIGYKTDIKVFGTNSFGNEVNIIEEFTIKDCGLKDNKQYIVFSNNQYRFMANIKDELETIQKIIDNCISVDIKYLTKVQQ
jgi:DNA-binding MarR family transcriptional regulator